MTKKKNRHWLWKMCVKQTEGPERKNKKTKTQLKQQQQQLQQQQSHEKLYSKAKGSLVGGT